MSSLNIKSVELKSKETSTITETAESETIKKSSSTVPSIQIGFSTGSGKQIQLTEKAKQYFYKAIELEDLPNGNEAFVPKQSQPKASRYTFCTVKPVVEIVTLDIPER